MKLKQIPEDFYVKEINNIPLKKKGDHCYILLKKKNWTTTRVIESLAQRLRVDQQKFHFAGLKDKDGITEQIISGYKIDIEFLNKIKIKDVELKILGFGDDPVKMGSHQGNEFIVVVRDLEKSLNIENLQVPNYFDDQRFGGSIRAITHLVGEALVEGDHERAVQKLLLRPFPEESPENKKYRQQLEQQWPDMKNIVVPKNLFDEQRVIKSLQEFPQDYKRAIRSLNKRLLMLCIHAYQSYLFNLRLVEYIETEEKYAYVDYVLGKLAIPLKKIPEKNIPLVGVEIPSIPEFNMRTTQRSAVIIINKIQISELEKDELNKGKYKQTLTFSLPSGSYATIVAKTLFVRS